VTLTSPPGGGNQVLTNPDEILIEGTFGVRVVSARVFIDREGSSRLLGEFADVMSGDFSLTEPAASYAVADVIPPGTFETENGEYTVRVVASTGPDGSGISSEVSGTITIDGQFVPDDLPTINADGNAEDVLSFPPLAVSAADGAGDGSVADFGADGTLTELRAGIRQNVLGIGLRGEMFGDMEDNFGNVSFVFLDVDGGSGDGVKNVADDLSDTSDGLRTEISAAALSLAPGVVDNGFDAVVAITEPGIAFGYTFGTDGLPGSFSMFEFAPAFIAAYDSSSDGIPAADGTTITGSDTLEVRIPLDQIGNPDPLALRFAAGTASDLGFPSPNTLPENTSDEFTNTQQWDSVAAFPVSGPILINEVFTGETDVVELYNPGIDPLDVSGWAMRMLDSADVARDFVFPDGTMIPANGYLLISDEGGFSPPPDTTGTKFAGFNIPWDDSRGGSISLVDRFGIGKDFVTWRNVGDDPSSDPEFVIPAGTAFSGTIAGADAPAHSLGRDANSTDTNMASDWEMTSGADADAPTLGGPNVGGTPVTSDYWMLH